MDHGTYLKSAFGLEGKTVMITGAAGGIGAAISEGLAYAGAEVALCGRTLEKCQALADRINANGGKASAYHLDVSDMSEIVPRVEEIVARYGKIDVLFNVAGINKREGLLDVEEETYDRIMNTNLKGVYFVTQAVAREMYKRKSGSIINIGSVAAVCPDRTQVGYGVAKSGINHLSRQMARQVAHAGVRVNVLNPGIIATEAVAKHLTPETQSRYTTNCMIKHLGEPIDIAYMALYLASDESKYVTAHVMNVSGGWM